MVTLMAVPSNDRHTAHRFLSETLLSPGQERNFQFRLIPGREPKAAVRLAGAEIDVPAKGAEVMFEIEAVPLSRTRGKRRDLLARDDQINFIVGRLFEHAGLIVIDPEDMDITPTVGLVVRNDADRFLRPSSAVFGGTALVRDPALLTKALTTGIGQAKAYGYGMLIVKEI